MDGVLEFLLMLTILRMMQEAAEALLPGSPYVGDAIPGQPYAG